MSLKLDDDVVFNPSQTILFAIRHLDRKRKSHNLKSGIKSGPTKSAKKSEPSDTIKHINRHGTLYFYLIFFVIFPLVVIGLIKIFGNIIMLIITALFLYGMFTIFKYIYKNYEFSNKNRDYYIKNVIFPILKSIDSSFIKEPNNSLREKYKQLSDMY